MHHLRAGTISRAVLIEKDQRVVELWDRLLSMTVDEVMAIPEPATGERTSDFFYMTTATSNGVAGSRQMKVTSRMPELVEMMKRRVARLLPHVAGRVKVIHGDYTNAPNVAATWFIDPPYQPHADKATSSGTANPQGMGYAVGCKSSDLDYLDLGAWCRSRLGQTIVVEQEGADWLPFQSLRRWTADSQGQHKTEMLWTRQLVPKS